MFSQYPSYPDNYPSIRLYMHRSPWYGKPPRSMKVQFRQLSRFRAWKTPWTRHF